MKKAKLNIALTISSIVFSLILIESIYRFSIFGWDSFSIEKMNSWNGIGVSGLIQPSPYPEILFELKTKQNAFNNMVPFATNSFGMRDREYKFKKPHNVFRVAVIGDSYTMPKGIRLEDSYFKIIEKRLNESFSFRSYEFLNFGVSAYNLFSYLGVLRHKAILFNPDLILIGFCADNDYHVIDQEPYSTPYLVKGKTYPFFHSSILRHLLPKLKYKLDQFIDANNTQKPNNNSSNYLDEQIDFMNEIFSQTSFFGKENKIPIVVAYISNKYYPSVEIGKLITNHGLYFIDCTENFRDKKRKEFKLRSIDYHPNAKANKMFAETIYSYLEKNDLLNFK